MVKEVTEDSLFPVELANAGTKLVVADFYATWCGPCRNIAPKVAEYSANYPNVVFLKVDVEKCQDTATSQGVSAMPTFIFYRNKTKLDTLRGADPNALKERIEKWMGDPDNEEEVLVKGHMDLSSFMDKSSSECLNESDDHPFLNVLTTKGGYLESDCDEQLIINIAFNQPVKIHSLRLHGPPDKGPKNIKIFQNQPNTLDFDKAESMEPTQSIELTPDDLKEGSLIPLRFVKFQNVQNVTIFVKDNQSEDEITQIDYLGFIGSTTAATNMSDFKRVAGKKGESH